MDFGLFGGKIECVCACELSLFGPIWSGLANIDQPWMERGKKLRRKKTQLNVKKCDLIKI